MSLQLLFLPLVSSAKNKFLAFEKENKREWGFRYWHGSVIVRIYCIRLQHSYLFFTASE